MFMEALRKVAGVDDLRTVRECNQWLKEFPIEETGNYDGVIRRVDRAEARLALRAVAYLSLSVPAIYTLLAR